MINIVSIEIQLGIMFMSCMVFLYYTWRNSASDVKKAVCHVFGKIKAIFPKFGIGKQKRCIRIMADYCSSGLWDNSMYNCLSIDYSLVPLSSKLIKDIKAWQLNYDSNNLDWMLNPTESSFSVSDHDSTCKELALRVKKELGKSVIVEYYLEKDDSVHIV